MFSIDYWNNYVKPGEEVNCKAEKGDLVIELGGILYLLQRKNDFNNIVCFRTHNTEVTTLMSFLMYRNWLIGKGIQYVRIEGNLKRYRFLANVKCGWTIIQDKSVTDRNVFYMKLV